MDATRVNAGAKAAISTLRDSIAIGKEGGKLVGDVQADAHAVIVQQQRIRERERSRLDHQGSVQEQRAYQRFTQQAEESKATATLKAHILKIHGVEGWGDFLKAKAEIEAADKLAGEQVSDDEHRMSDMTWWCFAAGSLLAYLIVV